MRLKLTQNPTRHFAHHEHGADEMVGKTLGNTVPNFGIVAAFRPPYGLLARAGERPLFLSMLPISF
ncbi:MAG: hypothetical protein BWK78_03760 [Thiotrichaceae bacterium IS1]|nr:MAG: hypothetical protein BWK78_03760 [Thiotrichaceae bacterium IS1]